MNSALPFTVNAAGTGHIKNPLNRNDFGFTLGGPVRIPKLYNGRDKTFYFFNFSEQFRQTTITNNLVAGAPLPEWTAGISGQDANFGPYLANGQPNPGNVENPLGPGTTAGKGALSPTGTVDQMYQLFDPTTAHYVTSSLGSGYVETPFAGNIIP